MLMSRYSKIGQYSSSLFSVFHYLKIGQYITNINNYDNSVILSLNHVNIIKFYINVIDKFALYIINAIIYINDNRLCT